MRRMLVLALIFSIFSFFSLGQVSVAFAEGPILASAERAAQELAQRQAQFLNAAEAREAGLSATAVRAPQGTGGFNNNFKLWLAIGLAGALAATAVIVDNNVEDNTFSSLRTRRDGCSFLCT